MLKIFITLILGLTSLSVFAESDKSGDPSAAIGDCPSSVPCAAATRELQGTLSDQSPTNAQFKRADGVASNNCCARNAIDPERSDNTAVPEASSSGVQTGDQGSSSGATPGSEKAK